MGIALAQKVDSYKVPEVVKTALDKKYPKATKVTWEKEKGNYEANWGGKTGEDMSVQFSPNGIFIEQDVAIKVKSLPQPIFSYVNLHYKGAKISEAGKVTNAKGKTMYEVEVKDKDLLFDEKGNFLKVED
jgi:hypothetical protein